MDFITGLPTSRGYDAVLVDVDRFSKMSHFLPTTKTATSLDTARLVINNVVKLHGLPDDIISDRGPQFAAKFWHRLFHLFGVKVKLSSAHHPQTDGQTERVNQVLESLLRAFVNGRQNNWVDLLPFAEFAYNNARHESTGNSPFYINYGYHPRFSIHTPTTMSIAPGAESIAHQLRHLWSDVRTSIAKSQARYKAAADHSRSMPPVWSVGDLVWLSTRNLKSAGPSRKLNPKFVGPYLITELISDTTVRLQLPPGSRVHNAFHVSLLRAYYQRDSAHDPTQHNPPPAVLDELPQRKVDRIISSREYRRQTQYLVQWHGCPESEATWELGHSILPGALDAIASYHATHP